MIQRYSRKEMADVWTEQTRLQLWLKVEWEVCAEMATDGLISSRDWRSLKSALNRLEQKGGVKPARVAELEQDLKHDVIAFTTAVAEEVGPLARFIHFGLTSSDVIDTALSLQWQKAVLLLLNGIDALDVRMGQLARRYQNLPTIGRSHGIWAEPTSFGLKFLGFREELRRNRHRLLGAAEDLRVGKLSGAVGVNAHWTPAKEERILRRLGLRRDLVSTQVVARDRHAHLLQVMALIGTGLERMAVELRHLQRSEVGEVVEGFSGGQKGSSAMPHKRNPISSENITGCARLLRSYAQAAVENVVLWHERDISHSSVERVIFPDAAVLLDYVFDRALRLLNGLFVNESRVAHNLDAAGSVVYSGHLLLRLVGAGAPREDAYRWVQQCALDSLDAAEEGGFVSRLLKHPQVARYLPRAEILRLSQLSWQLRNVPVIFQRAEKGTRRAKRTR